MKMPRRMPRLTNLPSLAPLLAWMPSIQPIRERRTRVARGFFAVALLLAAGVCTCFSKTGTAPPVELREYGLPDEAFSIWKYARCPEPLLGYHAVRWLDAERVLVAFNTTSICPKKETWHRPANLRLIVFDLKGNRLRQVDVPYEAAMETSAGVSHDGVWVGPGRKDRS